MRLFLGLGLFILLCMSDLGYGQEDYRATDSLIVESVNVSPGEQAKLKVSFVNSEELGAVTIPLIIRLHRANFDSISFAGSRVEYMSVKPVTIAAKGQLVVFGAICMMENYLPPGKGLLATLYISVTDTAGSDPILVDSTSYHPASLLFAKSDSHTYLPVFIAGNIAVNKPSDESETKN